MNQTPDENLSPEQQALLAHALAIYRRDTSWVGELPEHVRWQLAARLNGEIIAVSADPKAAPGRWITPARTAVAAAAALLAGVGGVTIAAGVSDFTAPLPSGFEAAATTLDASSRPAPSPTLATVSNGSLLTFLGARSDPPFPSAADYNRCLDVAQIPPSRRTLLGSGPVQVSGQVATVLLLPGLAPGAIEALVTVPSCGRGDPHGVVSRRLLGTPQPSVATR